jgi:hypothetical protein
MFLRIELAAGLALAAAIVITGCAGGPSKTIDSCAEPFIGGLDSDSISSDGFSAQADLDCSDTPETIRVHWDASGEVHVPTITVQGVHHSLGLALQLDGLPRIMGFGDMDGDSIRDILLAVVDESTVRPVPLLVRRDALLTPELRESLDWRDLQFLHDDLAPRACVDEMLPRIEADPGKAATLWISTGISWENGCERPAVVGLRIVDGMVTKALPD